MIRFVLPLLATLAALAAQAEGGGSVYKDAERSGFGYPPPGGAAPPPYADPGSFQPARRTDRSPGYVGSDFGLGKPAFTGLGSRPDWGRSSE